MLEPQTMRGVILALGILPSIALMGCVPRQDRWTAYSDGGDYRGGAPSMSSTDGTIVFSSPRSGNGDIYQWNPTDSSNKRLTTSASFESGAVYSRDGKSVAFEREKDGYSHIFVLDLTSGAEKQVTFGQTVDSVHSFSPDGTALIVHQGHYQGGRGIRTKGIVVNLTNLNTPIDAGQSAVFSTNGEDIYYNVRAESTEHEVWAMDRSGHNRHLVCDGTVVAVFPNGQDILIRQQEGSSRYEKYNVVTAEQKSLQFEATWNVTLSQAGDDILFTGDYGKALWRYHIPDATIHQIDILGHIRGLRSCRSGVLAIHLPIGSKDRCGNVCLIDSASWQMKSLFSIAN